MAHAALTALLVLLALMVAGVIPFEGGWAWAVLALAAVGFLGRRPRGWRG
ncbi:hypothetical protein HRbin24_01342 [bacterium HR24]|jgi:hypothetical protein|nr:hypothetical protein HRbin24_01342 [bacterium HR24]